MLRNAFLLFCGIFLIVNAAFAADMRQGNWEGAFKSKAWKDVPVSAKVIAEGRDRYRAVFDINSKDGKSATLSVTGKLEKDKVSFDKEVDLGSDLGGTCKLKAKIDDDEFEGKFSGSGAPGKFEMNRVEKKSPTLGAKPPADAVVLFDGTSLDAWNCSEMPWKLVDGGAMEVRKGSIRTKQEFGSQKLHVEFRTPLMAGARGQGRGNSGVYVVGRVEVQVLDSFGLEPKDNECGGIYKKATPLVNACLPPTEWQTYDITFHVPEFNDKGERTKKATISVEHNGILIHDNVELDGVCGGGVGGDEAAKGPLMLQDHHNPVQYRNIWVQPL